MKTAAATTGLRLAAIVGLLAIFHGTETGAATPTFQALMDPSVFPGAQRGMKVESVAQDAETITITTTGASIVLNCSNGAVSFRQRIGHERPVVTLELNQALRGVKVTHKGDGFARVTIDRPQATIRVNGDSLFLLHAHEALRAAVREEIVPAWNASWKTNHLIVDEFGGFGLYCSDLELQDQYDAYNVPVATYSLPANAVLAVGVCPPKPYDWDRSLRDQVIWHWSNLTSYPPDDELQSWKPYGNLVLLQSEVLLWKDWNLDFVPRLGPDEWTRVRNTIHGMGLPFIVYTSPYFFLKGTSQEKQAVNDQPGVCPGAIVNGENMPLFLDAIRRVMRELKPEGLYFDGQYMENPAALYALARYSREIIGEEGILEWHSTTELGSWDSLLYMPQADAYADIQLRGEGRDRQYADFDYLRFFVSGYNINNCIGVLCNNSGKEMSVPQLEAVLKANARLHTLIGHPAMREFILNEYRPRLTPEYRASVDRLVAERQQRVREKADAMASFLKEPSKGLTPAMSFRFNAMPDVEKRVSAANPDALSIVDGLLHIRAHAHTFAFLRLPVNKAIGGFEIKLRQGNDKGMSWGPAAMVNWSNGDAVRIGARWRELQVDIPPLQTIGPPYDPSTWVWLRARWKDGTGVVEYSADGVQYKRFHLFPFTAGESQAVEVLVGKVPCNGKAEDYAEPGELGECDIDSVRLFAP
ncbi:MAG: hypothetical protein NTU83_04495 [Candidatus Hydrogenedentes bacterium]|nr:hypothetical protein [Candidatus Hydrogenedentota bacterium]